MSYIHCSLTFLTSMSSLFIMCSRNRSIFDMNRVYFQGTSTPSDCYSFAEGLLFYDIDFLLCLVTCSFLKIQLKCPPFRKFLKSYLSILWALCAASKALKYFYLRHLYVVVFHGSVSCLCSKRPGDRGHILCQLLYLIQCWV